MPEPELLTPTFPLTLFIEHLDKKRDGTFRPQAHLRVGAALRTSGFWNALSPDDFKTFFLLLTYLTPNGGIHATLADLAEAMRVSGGKARSRLEKLRGALWQGQPVIIETEWMGQAAYSPLPGLLEVQEENVGEWREALFNSSFSRPSVSSPAPSLPVPQTQSVTITPSAPAENVPMVVADTPSSASAPVIQEPERIAEPEPLAAAQQVFPAPELTSDSTPPALSAENPDAVEAGQQLLAAGLTHDQAIWVLSRFELARIRRQLGWLPLRRVRNPAGFLLAAIEGDYEAPRPFQPRTVAPFPVPNLPVSPEQGTIGRTQPTPIEAQANSQADLPSLDASGLGTTENDDENIPEAGE